jgi:hypothetical protein
MRAIGFAGLASAVLLAACTAGGPSPASSAADFAIEVTPPEVPPEVRAAIPGQRVCFLVVLADDGGSPAPVTISATADGAEVGTIEPLALVGGVVGEVWVVPAPATAETTASVTITATRGSITKTETRSIPIFPMIDERGADAQPHFERWVAWLASAHPELGITAATGWEPGFVSILLVVSHYAYFSDQWEMTIAWHNMIPPYDWSEVHLRKRGVDVRPSLAFRTDSVSGATEPHEVEPPEVVVR